MRAEDGVGEFEEGGRPAVEAFVKRVAEGAESIGRIHDAPIMHSPTAFRTPYLPVELKRKLSIRADGYLDPEGRRAEERRKAPPP